MANAPAKPGRFALIAILALAAAMLAMGLMFHSAQTQRKRDIAAATTAATTALKKAGATIDDSQPAFQISFRDTALDDDSLATIAAQLRAFNQISVRTPALYGLLRVSFSANLGMLAALRRCRRSTALAVPAPGTLWPPTVPYLTVLGGVAQLVRAAES